MAEKRIQEIVDRLTVMDDTFFHKLVEDKEFCEELIQTVTGNKGLRLVEVAAQKSLRNIKGRSVVLDAYCVDAEHNHFNLEIQKEDDDDHQRRVRYNASNMDTYIAEKGTRFEHIPNSYVIYISKHDFWKKAVQSTISTVSCVRQGMWWTTACMRFMSILRSMTIVRWQS